MPETHGFSPQEPQNVKILKDLAESLNEANDVSSAMDVILPRLGQVLGLSTAWAFRFDSSRSSFVEVGASGLPPALAENNASPLKSGWCECQSQFVEGRLHSAVNLVRCSRLRDAEGDKQGLMYHASVPLRSKGKPLGILNVAATGPRVFTEDALSLLTAIGHQVAVAVDRAGLLSAERQRSLQLKALSEIAAELVGFVDNEKLLQFAVDRLLECLSYDACGILDENEHDAPVLVAAAHRDAPLANQEYSYSQDNPPPVLPQDQQVILADARCCLEKPIPQSSYRLRVESREANALTDADGDLLTSFAWHITAALENVKLYNQSVNNAKWQERRRLAADLHDVVSQRLFSALLLTRSALLSERHTSAVQDAPREKSTSTTELLGRIELLIAQSQDEMRQLIQALRPVQQLDLVAAIRTTIAPLELQSRLRITVNSRSPIPRLQDSVQQTLLNVMNEAVQNLLRHSQCTRAEIDIGVTDGTLILRISDNGVGFDVSKTTPGLGTSTMRERMAELRGYLTVASSPGQGCRVEASVPMSVCEHPAKGGKPDEAGDDSRVDC